MEIQNLEKNVDKFSFDGRTLYLVGTAHVSRQSAELVERVIRDVKPDAICLELDDARYESLQDPERWKQTNIFDIIKSGRSYVLMAQLALSSFQRRIAKKFGIKPGQEMISAIEVSKELDIPISLVDREVKITMKRAWAKARIWSMVRMMGSVVVSLFVTEDLSEDEIEELKDADAMSVMMGEFSSFLPGVKEALIDERDKYLSKKIYDTEGEALVAVVGAGHVPGMEEVFGTDIDLAPLEELPPPRLSIKAIAWGVPILVAGLIITGFFRSGAETTADMVVSWFLANGIFSAIGAAIALGHPLTVIAAFVAAPFTSLNPTIAAGWVAGLVEAFVRKPRVGDLESIADDITTLGGLWKNRVSRILLVIALANLGSMVGTAVGVGLIAALL